MIGAVRLIFDFSPEKRRYGSDEILIGIAPAAHGSASDASLALTQKSNLNTVFGAIFLSFTQHVARYQLFSLCTMLNDVNKFVFSFTVQMAITLRLDFAQQ